MAETPPRSDAAPGAEPGARDAVRRYAILDTAPERPFDDITAWAARLCQAPMAILSLVDRDRHWFKSRFGLAAPDEAGRADAFCEHVTARGIMVVPDARVDARFAANPFVVGEPHVRFYAGCPLLTGDDQVIGTLSVLDRAARTLAPDQGEALAMLARVAMTQLELRRHVMELEDAEARTRLVVESTLDAVVTTDAFGRVTGWNPHAEQIFGWRRDEILGRLLSDTVIPERYRAGHEEGLARFRATGEGRLFNQCIEIEALHRAGHEFPVELAIAPLRLGGTLAFSAFVRDITERVRLEEQLRQAQKMDAVGRLAGGVAHDFNNLLTVILGRSDLLAELVPEGTPARRAADLIQATARKASSLTQQLLALSRKQVLQRRVLDLGAVVAGIEPVLRRLIGEDIEVSVARDPGPAWVAGDSSQLEQVVLNLAVNARDAMPHGGRLALATRSLELDEAFVRRHPAARPGPHVMVSATDTGHGMDAETRARIFEPFFTTKSTGKGTGLGLATVYGIVKQHDGYIAVDSAPGAGTTFVVYLPRVEAPAPEAAVDAAPAARGGADAGATRTVLVVEDEEAVCDLAVDILGVAGFHVVSARSPEAALVTSAEHPGAIDLLLTDVVMPGMSGRELAERVAGSRPDTAVLYMSGYSAEALGHRGVLDPGIALLVKPFTPASLVQAVRTALAARSARR